MKAIKKLAIVLTAICVATSAAAQTGKMKDVTIMLTQEPPQLISAFNTTLPNGVVGTKVMEGLLAYDEKMQPKPNLATSWSVSDDGLEYTFKLRPNVSWHDGKPFTSADVAYSAMNVWKALHPRGRTVFSSLTAVNTPDPLTAVFKLSKSSPVLLSALHSYESQILPKHLYEGTDVTSNPWNLKPVGTGPFVFKEWRRGQYIMLERNPNYWDKPKPAIDRLILRLFVDPGARSAAFENGSADIGYFSPVTLADAERLKKRSDLTVTTDGYQYATPMFFMELNLRKPPLNDVRVRRAISHAIDRQFIIKNIFMGYAKPATGPIQSSSRFYEPDVAQYPYDPAKANALLDEAGLKRGPDGMRFRITHDPVPQNQEHSLTADYVKQALAKVGIDVEIRKQDLAAQIQRVSSWNFDMSSNPLFAMFDPALGVTRLFWSGNIKQGIPFTNVSGFSDPLMDSAIEAQLTERDPKKRKEAFSVLQKIAQQQVPLIYLLEVNYLTVANKRLNRHTVDGAAPFSSFADVTVD